MRIIKLSMWLIVLFLVACTKDFEEINKSPNNPEKASTAFLLTSAQKNLANNIFDEWFSGRFGMQMAQYWASNSYTDESRYSTSALRSRIADPYWRLHYNSGLQDLQEIINIVDANPRDAALNGEPDNQKAVALILQSYVFQIMTDTWGMIPYSEALQGKENAFPKYDTQEEIYNGLLAHLNEAIGLIKQDLAGPSGDQIYFGNMAQWYKFANSLKMRVAIRVADRLDATSKAAIQEAFNAGPILTNADNALFHYLGALPNTNPIYEDYLTRKDFASSNTMVDTLLGLNDPRIGYYYAPAASSGDFIGERYGMTDGQAAVTTLADVSQRSAKVLAADFPGIMFDAAETQFILAEAAERWPDLTLGGSAQSFYNEGIRLSMEFWSDGELTAGQIDDYLAQPSVDYLALKGAGLTYKQIIGFQKWIALYTQGVQGWSEWRRLDFGVLRKPAGSATFNDPAIDPTAVVPLRLMYPSEEATLNADNFNAAVTAQGPNTLRTRLWWDVE